METMKSTYDEENKLWKGFNSQYPLPKDVYIGEKIFENLKSDPKKLLQISHDEKQCLYAGDFLLSITRVAQNMVKSGFKSNDVAGVICLNSNTTSIFINACILIGVIPNPLDPIFTEDDISHMFNQTKPKLVVCDSDVYHTVKQALENIKIDAIIYTNGREIPNVNCFEDLLTPTGIEDEFMPPKFNELADEKILGIVCSSGTTGQSKGVCLSHAVIFPYFRYYENSPPSRSLTFSTAYWQTGFFPCVTLGFAHKDVRILTKQRFNVDLLIELLEKYEVTSMIVPPSQLTEMVQSDKLINCDHKLKSVFSGGSLLSESLCDKFKAKFPNVIFNVVYGMTEYGVALPISRQFKNSPGNFLNGNNEIKIVDDDENRLGVGEIGELRVKNPIKFLGYYGNPKATEEAYDDEGFFKSGDICYFDENRYLFIIDRKKDILKYKGYQYNPSEIEAVIETIEGVKFVSVVGIKDEALSDLPTAVIVKQDGYEESLTEEMIKSYIELKLPFFKHLHGGVFFVDKLPMTASGKIQKRKVVEMIMNK